MSASCACDFRYVPDELECVPEATDFADPFETDGPPDAGRWVEYYYSSGFPASHSVTASGGAMELAVTAGRYGWNEEVGVRSLPYFLVQSDSVLAVDVTMKPPSLAAQDNPAVVFFSDHDGADGFIMNDCARPGYCDEDVGLGKRGFGVLVGRGTLAVCSGTTSYALFARIEATNDTPTDLGTICSRIPGVDEPRSVRLEFDHTTLRLLEDGEELWSSDNPVPGMAGGNLYLAARSDRTGYPGDAWIGDVRVACLGACADEDFLTEPAPGWDATETSRCGWTADNGGSFSIDNSIQTEDTCSTAIDWAGGPFTLEFDFFITRLDWATQWVFGLWAPEMNIDSSLRIGLHVGRADGGSMLGVYGCDQSHDDLTHPPPLDTWLTARLEYTGTSVTIAVTERATNAEVFSHTLDGTTCSGLTRLGSTMLGYDRPAYGPRHLQVYVDNIRFSQ